MDFLYFVLLIQSFKTVYNLAGFACLTKGAKLCIGLCIILSMTPIEYVASKKVCPKTSVLSCLAVVFLLALPLNLCDRLMEPFFGILLFRVFFVCALVRYLLSTNSALCQVLLKSLA